MVGGSGDAGAGSGAGGGGGLEVHSSAMSKAEVPSTTLYLVSTSSFTL